MRSILTLLLFATAAAAQEAPPALGEIPVAEYQARRAELSKAAGDAIVVLASNAQDQFGEFARFRQDSDFRYVTGFEEDGAAVVLVPASLAPEGRPLAWLFHRTPTEFDERWIGPRDRPGAETARRYGVDESLDVSELETRLQSLRERHASRPRDDGQATPPLRFLTQVATPTEAPFASPQANLTATLARLAPGAAIEASGSPIAELRLIKSPAEQALIRQAIAITSEGLAEAARAIKPGVYEYEAQAALEFVFTKRGAERPGFFSIVGSGPNSIIPHYHANRRRMDDGDLVVVDVGAERLGYTADLTRTFPVSGQFTDRQREVYQLVLDAQRAAERAFVPGKSTIAELKQAASECMKASPLRDRQGESLDRYFTHGLGHWMGLDVHDVGPYDRPIPVGAVFTIEPGIYIPDERLGVRIEDDYLATETGLIKVSAELVSDPDAVERLMRPAADAAKP